MGFRWRSSKLRTAGLWWWGPPSLRLSTATGTRGDAIAVFDYPFMVNALRAGTIVAVVSGAMGWFMVLRRQTFAGHTLSLVGFPGAAGAILLGLSAPVGYFGFCVAAGIVMALASPPVGSAAYSEESAVI